MQLTCSICYDDIETTVNIDSCDHIFCRDCITKWAREKTNTCPCCRRKINVIADADGKIIDYFVDKENNDWIALDILWDDEFYYFRDVRNGFFSWTGFTLWLYGLWLVAFNEKIPYVTHHRRLNKSTRFMDMGHYQRELA
jgi:hypothetical protein